MPLLRKTARGDECDMGCGRHLEPGEIETRYARSAAEEPSTAGRFITSSSCRSSRISCSYLETLGGTASARNYAIEWVREELKDWCITRNMAWGVKFPGHNELVVYVWVDAPIGYIAFTEEWCARNGVDWKAYWKDGARIIHFIGEDIVYHHCIFGRPC